MWSDAGCTYAPLQYQHATAVALSAGQYIGVAPGEYIHLKLGDDTTDAPVTERMDQMLLQKMPQETGDYAAAQRRMKAGKQLGADMMTERVIREINQEKQLLAEPKPINVAGGDKAIITELGHSNDDMAPTDLQPQPDTMDMDRRLDKQHNDTGLPTPAHPRTTHQAQKTKAHNKTPQKTPTKTTPPPKKKKATPASPQPNQKNGRDGRVRSRHQTQRKRERTVKKTLRAKEKSEVPLPFALHSRNSPPPPFGPHHTYGGTRTPAPYDTENAQAVHPASPLPAQKQAGPKNKHRPPSTWVPTHYYNTLVPSTSVITPHNTGYNNKWVLQCGDVHPNPGHRGCTSSDASATSYQDPPSHSLT